MNLEELGITKEDLQDRVVDAAVNKLLSEMSFDADDDEFWGRNPLARKLNEKIRQRIDESVSALAEKHVLPQVGQTVENLILTQTNAWGEKKGEPLTFIEYLTQRADAYLREPVNHAGEDKAKCGSYGFTASQTRITYMVNRHLHYSIETAMQDALKVANSAIAEGISETVKLKLQEIVAGLQCSVNAKR